MTGPDLSWPLERAARQRSAATAVVDGDRQVTYAQLAGRVSALGAALDALDVAPGARVGVLADNSLAHVEAWLGVPAVGRVICDLNHRLAEPELRFMIDDGGVEALLVDDRQLDVARVLREQCPTLRELIHVGPGPCPGDCLEYEALVAADGEPAGGSAASEDALAAICYTGGTTGRAKGVMLSHRNLVANAQHHLHAVALRHDDRFLHVCPMFHVAGTANVFAATWVGATQVVLGRFEAAAVARAIEDHAITRMLLVPTMLNMLLAHLEQSPADLRSLREVGYAASPISPQLQRRVLGALPCGVSQFYGMTEAAPLVSHCTAEDHRGGAAGEEPHVRRLRSIGTPVAGV
jgi:long-chain acyl-CoA synthetase